MSEVILIQSVRPLSKEKAARLRLKEVRVFPKKGIERMWAEAETVELPRMNLYPLMRLDITRAFHNPDSVRLKPKQERYIFLKYNYLKHILIGFRDQTYRMNSRQLLRVESLEREVTTLEQEIVLCNVPLVFTMSERFLSEHNTMEELVTEALPALWRAVRGFDLGRGWKFSTYACGAIIKSLQRRYTKTNQYTAKNTSLDAIMEMDGDSHMGKSGLLTGEDQMQNRIETDRLCMLRKALAEIEFDDVEQVILRHRLLVQPEERISLEGLGQMVGLTKNGVRLKELQVMSALRTYFVKRGELASNDAVDRTFLSRNERHRILEEDRKEKALKALRSLALTRVAA